MKIETQEHYGCKVQTNVAMDILRRDQCLCLNCDRISYCEEASSLYDICRDRNLALMVTRCPYFLDKNEPDCGMR